MNIHRLLWFFGVALCILLLSSCAPSAEIQEESSAPTYPEPTSQQIEAEAAAEGEAPEEEPAEAAPADYSTQPSTPSPAPTQALPIPTSTPVVEARIIELEWPDRIHLGDSDVVRLAIIPSEDGYTVTTEFPEHQSITQDVPVIRPEGYDLFAVARLDGVQFDISPSGEQAYHLPEGEPITWHWSLTPRQSGHHRLTISLVIRWVPLPGTQGTTREAVAYSKGLDVNVPSILGMTRSQAMISGFLGIVFGSVVSVLGIVRRPPKKAQRIHLSKPNTQVIIETPAHIKLDQTEISLLQTLFQRYRRLTIEQEFLSGYSGARTFLALPIKTDGRADAHTIAKLGHHNAIEREYKNFETFVKDTLPPITARIQHPPIRIRGREEAALQYTFIGKPGQAPKSLRRALIEDPNPSLLERIFESFGPNWWSQRNAYTFRIAQEYDRLLPPHFELEPATGNPEYLLDGHKQSSLDGLGIGRTVALKNFHQRPRAGYYSLKGDIVPGHPPLRVRWRGKAPGQRAIGRIVATRALLLNDHIADFKLYDLPNPLTVLPRILDETISASKSIIHGDLNLENVLVGPGDFVWMIDFAETREGHPLADFAHMAAEIVSHVIAPQVTSPERYITIFQGSFHKSTATQENPLQDALQTLLTQVHEIATRCLVDPTQPREYFIALFMTCLGALKYRNLDDHQKHLLYLSAAHLATMVGS